MLRPGGVTELICDGVVVETVATSKCVHCQRMTDVPNRRAMLNVLDICRKCMGLICLNCAGKPCTPHMQTIERAESEYYRKQQFLKSMGF